VSKTNEPSVDEESVSELACRLSLNSGGLF